MDLVLSTESSTSAALSLSLTMNINNYFVTASNYGVYVKENIPQLTYSSASINGLSVVSTQEDIPFELTEWNIDAVNDDFLLSSVFTSNLKTSVATSIIDVNISTRYEISSIGTITETVGDEITYDTDSCIKLLLNTEDMEFVGIVLRGEQPRITIEGSSSSGDSSRVAVSIDLSDYYHESSDANDDIATQRISGSAKC